MSAARNTGIQAARREFKGLLDADDQYEPGFLMTMFSILISNPDAGAFYCGYQFVDENNAAYPREEYHRWCHTTEKLEQLFNRVLDRFSTKANDKKE